MTDDIGTPIYFRGREATVRAATPADASAMAAVHSRSARAAYSWVARDVMEREYDVTAKEQMWRDLLASEQHEPWRAVVVGLLDGRLCGFVSCEAYADDQALITALYADPDAWGLGLGFLMFERIAQAMRAAGIRTCSAWVLADNTRGLRAYERWGFSATGAREQDLLGDEVELVYELASSG